MTSIPPGGRVVAGATVELEVLVVNALFSETGSVVEGVGTEVPVAIEATDVVGATDVGDAEIGDAEPPAEFFTAPS